MKRTSILLIVLALIAVSCGGSDSGAQALADDCALDETDGDLTCTTGPSTYHSMHWLRMPRSRISSRASKMSTA